MQNYSLLALKMTELWLFSIFDLRGRGQRDVRDQNRGQISLEVIYMYFHAKFQVHSFKTGRVMAI